MTIRTRLTLWYASILFVSVLLIAGVAYHELREDIGKPIANPAEEEEEESTEILRTILVWGLPAAVIGIAGGWVLMRQALAPVSALTLAAEKINDRNLHEQLPRNRNGDELDRLTEVFNAMTARLDNSFQRIREFTLHASHELKTPLTVMHGELETALDDQTLSPTQRERVLSQLDEIQRLTKIVDGMTFLTKADAGQIELKREPVPLAELVREAFEDAQILTRPYQVQARIDVCDEITVHGDRHRLRQLLLNLTDNAVKYNQPNGTVTYELRRTPAAAELKIKNTGPGIASELLPKVFTRFFRGDTSRNNGIDGCGLGLSIAQWIVAAHGGTIQLASQPSKETTVTVQIPIARE